MFGWIFLGLVVGLVAGRFIFGDGGDKPVADDPWARMVERQRQRLEKQQEEADKLAELLKQEKEDPEVIYGDAEEVMVYQARDKSYVSWLKLPFRHFDNPPKAPDWHDKYFLSCEQAFAECGDCQVDAAKARRIAGKYFEHFDLKPLKLTKPKVAKGARK